MYDKTNYCTSTTLEYQTVDPSADSSRQHQPTRTSEPSDLLFADYK